MLSKLVKHQSQMISMILFSLGENQDIIKVHKDEFIGVWVEDEVHRARESRRGIGKPKRHDSILIRTKARSESCLGNIFFTDSNLVIAQPKINLGNHFSTFELLEQVVYVGKWVLILDCLLIQRAVIDAQSFRVILLDKKNTTTPRR